MPPIWLIVNADATAADLELDLAIVHILVEPQILGQLPAGQEVRLCTSQDLQSQDPAELARVLQAQNPILLPLTWHIPEQVLVQLGLGHPAWQNLWQTCQDPDRWQQHLHTLGYAYGRGSYWLPIVLTDKGPLYGEVIGPDAHPSKTPVSGCIQPIHLEDQYRQPLYRAGFELLQTLQAPSSTYCLQFGWQGKTPQFEKLWPFPIRPCLASLAVQDPDLFTCYWRTRNGLAVTDLLISGAVAHQLPVFAN
jgi:hypothetical protein